MKKTKNFIWIAAMSLLLAMCGCSTAADTSLINQTLNGCDPLDYGNGVYYFPCRGAFFGNSLSVFKKVHNSDLEFVGGMSDTIFGDTLGYFVVFRKIKK